MQGFMRSRQAPPGVPLIGMYSALDNRRRKEAMSSLDRSFRVRILGMAAMFVTVLLFIFGSIFFGESSSSLDPSEDDPTAQFQSATWRASFAPLAEVRWGLIGCGSVTEIKSGPALSLATGSKLVHVMRRNATLAADYARRHGVPRWSSDAEDVFADPEVNAIYIATPPAYHAKYAIRAAEVGKPVYVEKPAGRNAAETKSIDDAFKKAGLPLFIAYYRRALPNFRKVKEMMETGVIGEVRSVHVQYHRPPNKQDLAWKSAGGAAKLQSGASLRIASLAPAWRVDPEVGGAGGYLRDKGSHQIDLLEFFFGPLVHMSGSANNTGGMYPTQDMASANFSFASGVKGTASWCFICSAANVPERPGQNKPGPPSKILQEFGEIEGTRGRIRFQFFFSNIVEVWTNDGNYKAIDLPAPKHIQQPMIQAIVNALRGERSSIGDEKLENGVEEVQTEEAGKGRLRENWLSEGESATRTSHALDMIVEGKEWRSKESA